MKFKIVTILLLLLCVGMAQATGSFYDFETCTIGTGNLCNFNGCTTAGCPNTYYGGTNTTVINGSRSYALTESNNVLTGVYLNVSEYTEMIYISFWTRMSDISYAWLFYAGDTQASNIGYNELTIFGDGTGDLTVYDGGVSTDTLYNFVANTNQFIEITINNTAMTFTIDMDSQGVKGPYAFRNGAGVVDYINFIYKQTTGTSQIDNLRINGTIASPTPNFNFYGFGSSTTQTSGNVGLVNSWCSLIDDNMNAYDTNTTYTCTNEGVSGKSIDELINQGYYSNLIGNNYNGTFILAPPNGRNFARNNTPLGEWGNYSYLLNNLTNDGQEYVILGGFYEVNDSVYSYNISSDLTNNLNEMLKNITYTFRNNFTQICYVDVQTDALFGSVYNASHFFNNDGLHPSIAKQNDIAKALNSSFFNGCSYFNCSANPNDCNMVVDIPTDSNVTNLSITSPSCAVNSEFSLLYSSVCVGDTNCSGNYNISTPIGCTSTAGSLNGIFNFVNGSNFTNTVSWSCSVGKTYTDFNFSINNSGDSSVSYSQNITCSASSGGLSPDTESCIQTGYLLNGSSCPNQNFLEEIMTLGIIVLVIALLVIGLWVNIPLLIAGSGIGFIIIGNTIINETNWLLSAICYVIALGLMAYAFIRPMDSDG